MTANSVVDHYLSQIGPIAFSLYSCLIRYSDGKRTFVGTARLAESLGVTRRSAYRHLRRLDDLRLIRIERSLKPVRRTVYWILPLPALKSEQKSAPLFEQVSPGSVTPESQGSAESVTLQTQVATPVSQTCDSSVTCNKEEQDCFIKTQYQEGEQIPALAHTVITELSMTNVKENREAVEAAISAEAHYLGCPEEQAAQKLIEYGKRDGEHEAIDKWYFVDTKWRPGYASKSARPSAVQQREQRTRTNITAAIRDHVGADVGSGSRDDGARTDEARGRPVDGQALAPAC